jgi:hypothetical protein
MVCCDLSMADQIEALTIAYGDLIDLARSVDDDTAWQPTGCAGWAVTDLMMHLLFDAQRGLVAMGTPASGPADRDGVTYWADFQGPVSDPGSRRTRTLRTIAAAWPLPELAHTYAETARAVIVTAQRTPPDALVATQGHVLLAADLVSTLVVEAAVHHLDLAVTSLSDGPAAAPLALVRRTLDGLLGHPAPEAWDDRSWALLATGRRAADAAEIALLGADAARLPLLS